MKKVLKWIGIGLGTIVGLLIVVVGVLIASGTSRLNKIYDVQPAAIAVADDDDALARRQYLVSINCTGCHGENLAGTLFFEEPALGNIPSANLTAGRGGVGESYTDSDFIRAIRHGVRSDGKPILIMPSGAFYYYSDADLGAIIAYLRSISPVDNDLGKRNLKPISRVLFAVGAFGNALQAESIDHDGPRPPTPSQGVKVEYGEYLVNTGDCRGCHGEPLSGGQSSEPGAPFAHNLTPGGELAGWTDADFIAAMHTGLTPTGREIDGRYMPWEHIGRMTDDDLTAIFKYLEALPAQETTQ